MWTRKLFALVLLSAMALSSSSCTDAQWRRFQEVNSKIASYVNDAMLVLSIVRGAVELAVPAENRGSVSDVFEGIQACNEALQAEAAVVRQAGSALETPAQVAAAFPRFISAWEHLSTAYNGHNLSGSSAAPTHRAGFRAPAIVQDARPVS